MGTRCVVLVGGSLPTSIAGGFLPDGNLEIVCILEYILFNALLIYICVYSSTATAATHGPPTDQYGNPAANRPPESLHRFTHPYPVKPPPLNLFLLTLPITLLRPQILQCFPELLRNSRNPLVRTYPSKWPIRDFHHCSEDNE